MGLSVGLRSFVKHFRRIFFFIKKIFVVEANLTRKPLNSDNRKICSSNTANQPDGQLKTRSTSSVTYDFNLHDRMGTMT